VTLIKNAKGDGPDKWKAQITSSGTKFHLGMFETELEAGVQFAKAYYKLFVMAPPTMAAAALVVHASAAAAAVPAAAAAGVVASESFVSAPAVAAPAPAGSARAIEEDAPPETAEAPAAAVASAAEALEAAVVLAAEAPAAAVASAEGAMDEEEGHEEEAEEEEEEEEDEDDAYEEGEAATPVSAAPGSAALRASSAAAVATKPAKPLPKSRLSPEARAAKASLRRAAERVVKEGEWLEAGHAEKLLLAVLRAPFPPQDDDWNATGLEAPAPPASALPAGDGAGEDATGDEGSASVEVNEATAGLQATGPRELQAGQQVAQRHSDSGKMLKVWPSGTAAAKAMKTTLALVQGACVSGEELAGFKWEPFSTRAMEQGAAASEAASAAPGEHKSPTKATANGTAAAADGEEGAVPSGEAAGGAEEAAGALALPFKERADGVFQYHETRAYKGGNKLRDYQVGISLPYIHARLDKPAGCGVCVFFMRVQSDLFLTLCFTSPFGSLPPRHSSRA
jgi:hypothetical protein